MAYVIRMPQMGMEMDEGEVVEWTRDEGEPVEEGDVIAVVESEKATNEVEAREDGTIRRIVVPEEGTVEPGTPIGIFAGPDEDISDLEAEIEAIDAAGEAAGTGGSDGEGAGGSGATTGAAAAGGSAGAGATGESGTRDDEGAADVRATPGAKQAASERGVDLTEVTGTGPQGVITEDDVEDHAGPADESGGEDDGDEGAGDVRATPGAKQAASERGVDLTEVAGTGPQGVITEDDVADHAGPAGDTGAATRTTRETRELSRIQQTVSDRLSESYRNAVHVTVKRSFDAGALRSVRAAADDAGVDASLTDLLIKGVGAQLDAQPEVNALFDDGEHRLIEEVNVGVAVDADAGLLTPVVPSVTDRSAEAVAATRAELTERATSGEFTSEDLAGGTFTISNLGPFGIDSFDPVINPPEVAILGVGRVRDDGTMTLSLSFDHRVVNGADAARFLDGVVENLTDVATLASYFETDLF